MKVSVIHTGLFKLDGGAMFGVVPKSIWQKLERADANNQCTWAMRCLLVEVGDRKILIDTGIGNKQSQKFFSHYEVQGTACLNQSLAEKGLKPEAITDVFLTHLHFDHVGGAVSKTADEQLVPTFPNAQYWTNRQHYDWAYTPNARERASFLKENFVPLHEEGVLQFLDAQPFDRPLEWLPNFEVIFAYGHTEAMMIPKLRIGSRTLIYCADLVPSPSHVGMPYIMGYDVRPLHTLQEKEYWLAKAVEEDYILCFEHAPKIEACTLMRNSKGKIVVKESGDLGAFLTDGA